MYNIFVAIIILIGLVLILTTNDSAIAECQETLMSFSTCASNIK